MIALLVFCLAVVSQMVIKYNRNTAIDKKIAAIQSMKQYSRQEVITYLQQAIPVVFHIGPVNRFELQVLEQLRWVDPNALQLFYYNTITLKKLKYWQKNAVTLRSRITGHIRFVRVDNTPQYHTWIADVPITLTLNHRGKRTSLHREVRVACRQNGLPHTKQEAKTIKIAKLILVHKPYRHESLISMPKASS